MRFTINREVLLRPLQQVAGVVERRQTLPVLANVLLIVEGNELSLTGTDLEVELVAKVILDDSPVPGEITVPARKLMDICKSLNVDTDIIFQLEEQKLIIKSGRSRFSLSTLPAGEFPNLEDGPSAIEFNIEQNDLKRLISKTAFAMAQQDVRYYLNGMLLELKDHFFRTVATDGHRLALCEAKLLGEFPETQVIVPRKGVLELLRLFSEDGEKVSIVIGTNHIKARSSELVFTSKLVDGKFPDYDRVVPKGGQITLVGNRAELKQSFSRAAILSNEKYRGVRIQLSDGNMKIVANNPEQEEAEEEVSVDYTGHELEIGFNVGYLLEVLTVIEEDNVRISLSDTNSSALVESAEDSDSIYVVMPMRI